MGLDTVEFVLWAEKHFGFDIPDADAERLLTVGEFCRYVVNRSPQPRRYESVFSAVSAQLHSEYGIPLDKIHEGAAFVRDLGLD